MKFPPKLNHHLPTVRVMTDLFSQKPSRLDLQRCSFIRPAALVPLAWYLYENRQAFVVGARPPIRQLFQNFGLLKQKGPVPSGVFPLLFFNGAEEVAGQLESFLPEKGLAAYLLPILQLLAPGCCCGHLNLAGDWIFFAICSSQMPPLDDFRWWVLLEEFQFTGGRLWALQGNRFFDGRTVQEQPAYFHKTWVIFGFSLTNKEPAA